jgi:hypothetical protein
MYAMTRSGLCVTAFITAILVHVPATQGITMLDGALANTSFPSTKYSRWIGNFTVEDCDNTTAPLVTVDPDHNLCTLSNWAGSARYVNKIVFVESLFFPRKDHLNGCPYEERYLQAELAGAIGVLDFRANTVGGSSVVHSAGYEPNLGVFL